MKRIGLALALLAGLSFQGFGQEKIEDVVKSAPTRAKYPDSSAVVVRAAQTFTLDQSGNRTEEYFRLLEVFTLTGREKFSDFRIPFNKNEDRVEVLLARTYKGDGTAVDVEARAINDVTPPALADADMYANVIHRVLSFPAVDPGSVLAVQFRKEKQNAGNIEGIVYFQFDEPMVKKNLRIVIPGDKVLRHKIIGLKAELKEETRDGRKAYSLEAADSPQIKPEEWMPPVSELANRVVFSTYADWADACLEFKQSFYGAATPSAEIRRFTDSLVQGSDSELDRVRKIFLFVARDIRSVRFDFGEGGFDVNPAETVLKNKYGDWKDKSGLLTAMFKAAGISSYPVLVHSRAIPPQEDVPTLKQFDAVIVGVSRVAGGETLFLDPFADDSLFGYFQEGRGGRGLAVKPDGVEFLTVRCLPEAESVLRNDITGAIDTKGAIQAKISSELSGLFDRRARQQLKDMTAKELGVFYAESINKVCEGGQTIENELSDPKDQTRKVRISQEFRGQDFGLFQGSIMLVYVPRVPYDFSEFPSVPSLAKRLYPFRLMGEAEVQMTVRLGFPAGFKPLYLPEGFAYEKDFGEFSFSAAYDPAQSSVVIRKTLVFKKKDIPLEQYEEFKRIIDSFGITKNNLILLEKK